MKTTTKPANRFRRPVSAIISCLGPLLAVGPIASCGTGPSATTTSKPVSLRSEYQLRSWRESEDRIQKGDPVVRSPHTSEGTRAGTEHRFTDHDFHPGGGTVDGRLIAEVTSRMTLPPPVEGQASADDMGLYDDVARITKMTSSLLLAPDEISQTLGEGMIASDLHKMQASR